MLVPPSVAALGAHMSRVRSPWYGYVTGMDSVYFKPEDEGDGSYEDQVGRVYLHLDDGSTGDEGTDLGFMTLATAAEVARDHGAELDVDGPSRDEWDAATGRRTSPFRRLFRR